VCIALHNISYFVKEIEVRNCWLYVLLSTVICHSLAVLYNTRLTGVPTYLSSALDNYIPTRLLRSSEQVLLKLPLVKLASANKTFSVSEPSVWNSLSYDSRSASSLCAFKRILKT
jgi:hypothetical protein